VPPALTPQEARFLAFVGSGVKLSDIAEAMYVSEREVGSISRRVRRKLESRSLAQAILLAHKLGYVSLPDDDGVVVAQSPFAEGS